MRKGITMTVHHVLVPIDFSPYAEQALDYAIALAQKLQVRVTLLHVIQPQQSSMSKGSMAIFDLSPGS